MVNQNFLNEQSNNAPDFNKTTFLIHSSEDYNYESTNELVDDQNTFLDMLSGESNSQVMSGYNDDRQMANLTLDKSENISITSSYDLVVLLGPRRRELYIVIIVTVVYCVIFITGIFGNICTCVVIAKNRYMHTATNYYLFNLAISDLLVLVLGLPQETYSFWSSYPWIFGETFCVLRIMAAETSTYASILTITAFTVERYVAIVHPMKAQAVSSLARAVKVIVFVWFLSVICSIPMVVQFGIVYQHDSQGRPIIESATCNIIPDRYLKHTFEVATFLFFLTPMTVITVLYVLIGLAVRRSTLHRNGSDSSSKEDNNGTDLRAQQQARARRAVLKMLVAVVVAFFICWAPFHAQRLLVINKIVIPATAFDILFYVSGALYYVSSVINPILYNIMSVKFRRAFKVTIFRPCKKQKRKRTSFIAYKFCNGHVELDSDVSVSQLQKNGYMVPRPCNVCKIKNSRSGSQHSSGHQQNSKGIVNGEPFPLTEKEANDKEGQSLIESGHEMKVTNSRTSSFVTAPAVNRPYHSYA